LKSQIFLSNNASKVWQLSVSICDAMRARLLKVGRPTLRTPISMNGLARFSKLPWFIERTVSDCGPSTFALTHPRLQTLLTPKSVFSNLWISYGFFYRRSVSKQKQEIKSNSKPHPSDSLTFLNSQFPAFNSDFIQPVPVVSISPAKPLVSAG
jgi:hypothetical protein